MKKLLQINTVANTGSTGRIAEQIGQLAIKHGWESAIAYGRDNHKSQSQLIKIGNKWSNYAHVAQTRLFDRHGLGSRGATKQFINRIKDLDPDIIHLHNIHGYYLNYEILFNFLKIYEVPVVWTLHDCWAYTGHCTHYGLAKCERWKTQCHHCPKQKKYPKSYIDNSTQNYIRKKQAFQSVDDMVLVPVSKWMEEEVGKSFLNDYSTYQIYNGIDLNKFNLKRNERLKRKYKIEDKWVYLGVANIWEERKGLQDFVKLSRIINSDEVIVLIGLSKRRTKTLPENIIGFPRTNSVEELVDLYNTADTFVNPTYEDSFPTTNLEALACGTPVITYKTGGSPEAVDPHTGFVVPKGDVNQLNEKADVIKDRGETFYREACRERAERRFDQNSQFQKYLELYDKLLS